MEVIDGYYTRPNTWYAHQALAAAYLGYNSFDARQAFRLTRWLYAQVTTGTVRPSVLVDLATAHLATLRVVLPGASLLARLIARVRERIGRHICRQLQTRLSTAQQLAPEALLLVPAGERLTSLEVLRMPPTRVSAPALVAALQRVEQVRTVGVGDVPVQDVAEAHLARMARYAQLTWGQSLLRMSEERHLAVWSQGVV